MIQKTEKLAKVSGQDSEILFTKMERVERFEATELRVIDNIVTERAIEILKISIRLQYLTILQELEEIESCRRLRAGNGRYSSKKDHG